MKAILLFVGAMLGALAQTPAPRPEFDAASIRVNTDGGPYVFNGMKPLGTFVSDKQTLKNLIQEAYGITSGQYYFLPYLKAPVREFQFSEVPPGSAKTAGTSPRSGIQRPPVLPPRSKCFKPRARKWT